MMLFAELWISMTTTTLRLPFRHKKTSFHWAIHNGVTGTLARIDYSKTTLPYVKATGSRSYRYTDGSDTRALS